MTIKDPTIVRSAEGSVTADKIYCLFDNQPRTMLTRYIQSKYGMSPERYREYCGLPADYPMTAPGYKASRRSLPGVSPDSV